MLTNKLTASQHVWVYVEGYDEPRMYTYRSRRRDGTCTLDCITSTGWCSVSEDYIYPCKSDALAAQILWVRSQIDKHENAIYRESGYLVVAQNCLKRLEKEPKDEST